MIFTLSQRMLSKTMVLNPEGQHVYKIITADDGGTTTIHRANAFLPSRDQDTTTPDTASEVTLIDCKWSEVASILWKNFSLTKLSCELNHFSFNCEEIKRKFTFDDSKGRCFKWSLGKLGASPPILTQHDCDIPIARLCRPHSFFKSQKPYIEVDDDHLDALDKIIVTLVYVEKKRKFMQEVAESSLDSRYAHMAYASNRA